MIYIKKISHPISLQLYLFLTFACALCFSSINCNGFYLLKQRKSYNKNITGWFEVPLGTKGVWKPFENQRLMFYVPETDTEFDNVYFTTRDNICYKQEFAFRALLLRQEKVYREYTDVPVRYNSENE